MDRAQWGWLSLCHDGIRAIPGNTDTKWVDTMAGSGNSLKAHSVISGAWAGSPQRQGLAPGESVGLASLQHGSLGKSVFLHKSLGCKHKGHVPPEITQHFTSAFYWLQMSEKPTQIQGEETQKPPLSREGVSTTDFNSAHLCHLHVSTGDISCGIWHTS